MIWTLLLACQGGEDTDAAGPKGEPATVVQVQSVVPGRVSGVLITTATIESVREADVVPLSGGTVVRIAVEEGDSVEQGDLLAVLDNAMLDGAADRAQGEVDRIESQLVTLRELHTRGAVSDKELSDAEFSLKTAKAASREAGRSQAQTRLVAPFDGVVALRAVREGQYAPPGATAFRVVDPDHLRVVTSLPERDLSRVHVGQHGTIVSAYDAAVTAGATVARVAPVVDAGTGTFRATLDLEGSALRPGQFVTVNLEVDAKDGVLAVSREALVYEDGAPYVFVVVDAPPPKPEEVDAIEPGTLAVLWAKLGFEAKAETPGQPKTEVPAGEAPKKIARRMPVALGLEDPERVEVTRGVAVGDAVIVVGQSNLRDGAPVSLK
jgi:membrane fusion protein, multidrug efflux system